MATFRISSPLLPATDLSLAKAVIATIITGARQWSHLRALMMTTFTSHLAILPPGLQSAVYG